MKPKLKWIIILSAGFIAFGCVAMAISFAVDSRFIGDISEKIIATSTPSNNNNEETSPEPKKRDDPLPKSCDFLLHKMDDRSLGVTTILATLANYDDNAIQAIKEVGAFIFVHQENYVVIAGEKEKITKLGNRGFNFREHVIADIKMKPVQVRTKNSDEAEFASRFMADAWPEGSCQRDKPFCIGGAFDLGIQCLKERGLEVKICDKDHSCETIEEESSATL